MLIRVDKIDDYFYATYICNICGDTYFFTYDSTTYPNYNGCCPKCNLGIEKPMKKQKRKEVKILTAEEKRVLKLSTSKRKIKL